MPVETDTSSAKFAEYADPGRLVTGEWLEARLGEPGLVVVESDEDVLLYETGHIPGAVKVDWHTELNDPVVRDYVDGEGFAALLSRKGISRDDTVVIYGDKNNWWAAYALWVFSLFGHEDVRLLDGGRDKWIAEGRPITTEPSTPEPTDYPVVERDDTVLRAYKDDVLAHLGTAAHRRPLSGGVRRLAHHGAGLPRRGRAARAATSRRRRACRGRARSRRTAASSRVPSSTRSTAAEAGLQDGDAIVAYCRIGERSSHTWFVLRHLLGFEDVRNYDGSWTEWGSAVRVPIVTGAEPGAAPAR